MDCKAFILPILPMLAALCLCGCANGPASPEGEFYETDTLADTAADTIADTAADTRITSPEESPEAISARPTVTFAPAETEPVKRKTSAAKTEETAAVPLAENQIEYTCKDYSVLMEFTGADSMSLYPKAVSRTVYTDKYYVLHSKITVTNFSEKDFDFYTFGMYINGSNKNNRGTLHPTIVSDTELAQAEAVYTVEPGEAVSFEVDFVGNEFCIDYAEKIAYQASRAADYNDNSYSAKAGFEISKRSAVKKAVSAARNADSTPAERNIVNQEK